MKYILLISFYLFTIDTNSQIINNNGKVHYTVTFSPTKIKGYLTNQRKALKNKKTMKIFDDGYLNSKNVEAILKFNKNESFFKYKEQLRNGSKHQKDLLSVIIGVEEKFYSNLSTKESLTLNCHLLGECFLISSPFNTWKLTQETKVIGKYICYKAEYVNKTGGAKRKITAWYTPEIAVNFGPGGYNGLPGLILQLDDETILFSASQIQFNSKEKITIERPKKGKKVSEIEFNKIIKEVFEKIK